MPTYLKLPLKNGKKTVHQKLGMSCCLFVSFLQNDLFSPLNGLDHFCFFLWTMLELSALVTDLHKQSSSTILLTLHGKHCRLDYFTMSVFVRGK